MNDLVNSIIPFNGLWSILWAILLLIAAFIVSAIVSKLVVKLLNKLGAEKALDKLGVKDNGSSVGFIGKLVYCIVFLLFVPGILSLLGLDTMSAPILSVLNSIIGYIPNIVGAVILLVIGFFIAKLIRQLLTPVFARLQVDKIQEKAGIEVSENGKLSSVLAYIVYVIILIPIVIAALNALGIRAISDPAINMLNTILNFIPNIVVALIIIIVGVVIGKFAGQIVGSLLAASGLDSKITKLIPQKDFKFAKTIDTIVQAVIIIFFAVEGVSVLNLDVLSTIGVTVIAYMPKVLSAIIIFILCLIAASKAEIEIKKVSNSTVYAVLAKSAIMVVGGFMILSQLNFATQLVNIAFVLILGALAVAFAVAFGIGGRDFASRALLKLESKDNLKQQQPKDSVKQESKENTKQEPKDNTKQEPKDNTKK